MQGPADFLFHQASELWLGLQFVTGIVPFLRHSMGADAAVDEIEWRLMNRERLFLNFVQDRIFSNPGYPYCILMNQAGCEAGDLRRLVQSQGVEGTLRTLYRSGVYLTVDEFKGRKPVVRGSQTFPTFPAQFHKSVSVARLKIHTSSSRGNESSMPVDFPYIQSRTPNLRVDLMSRRGMDWQHALWGIPGGSAMVHLLEYSKAGARPVRWFSHVNPASPALALRYRWSVRAMRLASLVSNRPLPRLQYATVEDPSPILEWIVQVLRRGAIPHLLTYTSPAVRLCQAAGRSGVSLSGLQMTLVGEPITAVRLEIIRRSGVNAIPRYGTTESGSIGYGCLRSDEPDDVHFLSDRLALISDEEGINCPAGSLLVTTLLSASPFTLVNVSLGDQAVLRDYDCGCPLQSCGWTRHIQKIRSFEKLTLGGMNFLKTDVSRIMDELLPRRFGGAPTHYQLVEEEGEDGCPRLLFYIHPAVGEVDPHEVKEAFLQAISQGKGVERMMGTVWRDAGMIEVKRKAPIPTISGKIHHFLAAHIRKDENSHV